MNKRLLVLSFAGAVLAGFCSAWLQVKEASVDTQQRPSLRLIIGEKEEMKSNDARSRH